MKNIFLNIQIYSKEYYEIEILAITNIFYIILNPAPKTLIIVKLWQIGNVISQKIKDFQKSFSVLKLEYYNKILKVWWILLELKPKSDYILMV